MNKLTFKKIILAYVMATISFVAMSQSTGLPLAKMSISKVEEKSYFDPKDLVSNYVSWGVNLTNPASINLLEA